MVPVRRAAWLAGAVGLQLERQLRHAMASLGACVVRVPQGFRVEAEEAPGVLLEAVHRAVQDMEAALAVAYPLFHREIGPFWDGTLQCVFDPPAGTAPARPRPCRRPPQRP